MAGPLPAGVLIPTIGLPELYLIDAVALRVTVWAVFQLPALPPLGLRSTRRAGVREVAAGHGTSSDAARTHGAATGEC